MKNWLLTLIVFISYSGIPEQKVYAESVLKYNIRQQAPDNKQYKLLQKAVERYERIQQRNDWNQIVVPGGSLLKLNDISPAIAAIKARLELLGDVRRPGSSDVFTPKLEEAVRSFQLRHGLEDNGQISPAFLKALNVSINIRIQQIAVNMERVLRDTIHVTGKRIIVNIPEYKLYVYEDSREVLSMDIVVGKTTNPTVLFSDTLEHIVFSPYWNVPASIVKNEILPVINTGYLKKHNMEITSKVDGLPVIRQKPGSQNALGNVKFLFPNKYDIYFHDTPSKSLFAKQKRAFSHGCIRLSRPFELSKYVLKDQSEWTDEKIRAAMNAGKEKRVNLAEKIPVSIIYYTSWVDQWGQVNFRDDIYGHDKEQRQL